MRNLANQYHENCKKKTIFISLNVLVELESSNSVKHYCLFRLPTLNYGLIKFNLNTLDAEYT